MLQPIEPARKVQEEAFLEESPRLPARGAPRRLLGPLVLFIGEGLPDPVALQRSNQLEGRNSPQGRDRRGRSPRSIGAGAQLFHVEGSEGTALRSRASCRR